MAMPTNRSLTGGLKRPSHAVLQTIGRGVVFKDEWLVRDWMRDATQAF